MTGDWPRPRSAPPATSLSRVEFWLPRALGGALAVAVLVFLVPGWLWSLPMSSAEAQVSQATEHPRLEPQAQGWQEVAFRDTRCYVAGAAVTWGQFAEIRKLSADVDASAAASVNLFEAIEWVRDYEASLRARYPASFATGGGLDGYHLRLPSAALARGVRVEGTAAPPEWLAPSGPATPRALGALDVALDRPAAATGGGEALPTDALAFRLVLLPQSVCKEYP